MLLKNSIKQIIGKFPYIRTLKKKLDFYEQNLTVTPGHFYSPLVNIDEIISDKQKIFDFDKTLHGIDLNHDEQFQLLIQLKGYYSDLPFEDEQGKENRYYYNNEAFQYADAIFLFSIIRHFKPKKIIEIGSGFSSAAILDTNELFFNNSINLTFIEPYPEVLRGLAKKTDKYTLIESRIQDLDSNLFSSLEENDILFIDSTHVAKTNSDVLFEIFQILPLLKKGVKIHFHDVFYPFEYPMKWVIDQKRNWNELYFLRSFLMFNKEFKIMAFNTYLEYIHPDWFKHNMPQCMKNTGGSLWIEKL